MDERQKRLVKDYGPRFLKRSMRIQKDFLYLPADAISIFTEEEWRACANYIEMVEKELIYLYDIIIKRMKENGINVIEELEKVEL